MRGKVIEPGFSMQIWHHHWCPSRCWNQVETSLSHHTCSTPTPHTKLRSVSQASSKLTCLQHHEAVLSFAALGQQAYQCILHSHPMPLDLNCSPCNNLHLFDQACGTWTKRICSECWNPQLCFWTQSNQHPHVYCILILCLSTSIAHLAITYIFLTKHAGHGQRGHSQNAKILSSVSGHKSDQPPHACMSAGKNLGRIAEGKQKNCCHLHGMKALDDENLWRINSLRRVQETRHMVVNWLLDRFPFLECLHLLIHEIKIVGPGVQSRYRLLLPPIPIQGMVIIQTNDRGRIADKRIGIRVSTPGRSSRASKHARQSPHKCTFPTTRISRQANNHCLLSRCDFTHHHCTPSNSKSTPSNAATATTTMLPVHSQQQRWQAFPLLLPGTTTTQTTLLSMELRLEVQFAEGRRWSWSCYCCRRRHGHRIWTPRQTQTNKRKSANGEDEELSERVCNNNGSSDNSEASKQRQ